MSRHWPSPPRQRSDWYRSPQPTSACSRTQEMPKSLLPPAPPRNRQPNSSSHSAGIRAPCCSTTDLVHPAVLNHAVGLAISAADLAGVHITFGQDDTRVDGRAVLIDIHHAGPLAAELFIMTSPGSSTLYITDGRRCRQSEPDREGSLHNRHPRSPASTNVVLPFSPEPLNNGTRSGFCQVFRKIAWNLSA